MGMGDLRAAAPQPRAGGDGERSGLPGRPGATVGLIGGDPGGVAGADRWGEAGRGLGGPLRAGDGALTAHVRGPAGGATAGD